MFNSKAPLTTLRSLALPALLLIFMAPLKVNALPMYFNEAEDGDLELVYDSNAGGIQFDQFKSFELTEGVSRFEGLYSANIGYGHWYEDSEALRIIVGEGYNIESIKLTVKNVDTTGYNYYLGSVNLYENSENLDSDGFCAVASPNSDHGCDQLPQYPMSLFEDRKGYNSELFPLGSGVFDLMLWMSAASGEGPISFEWSLDVAVTPTPVPEPGTLALLSIGLISLIRKARTKR